MIDSSYKSLFMVTGNVLSTLHILSHLILTTIIKDPILYGEIETWNDYINVRGFTSRSVEIQGFQPGDFAPGLFKILLKMEILTGRVEKETQ